MEQIVNYLMLRQEKVKFHDRTATLIRNDPLMTQLDFSTCKRHNKCSGRSNSNDMLLRKQHGRWVKVLLRLRLLSNIVIKTTMQFGGVLV